MTHGTEQCRFERPQMKVFEKTVQKQATLWITVGKRTGFEPLFGPFLDTFLKKSLNFFDLVFSRYSDPSGDFAPLPCTVYLVIFSVQLGSKNFWYYWANPYVHGRNKIWLLRVSACFSFTVFREF